MTFLLRRKLHKKYASVLLPLVITFFMTCIVSGISTIKNIGFNDPLFYGSWIEAWGVSWVVAFPVLLVILPFARKIVFTFVEAS